MTMRGYTAQQIRDAEAPHLAAGEPLMQRAAHGLAESVLRLLEERHGAAARTNGDGARVLLLVGSGDNGGDALFAGAELAARGVEVGAIGVGSRMHEAGREAADAAGVTFLDAEPLLLAAIGDLVGGVDVVVDGILGTGTAAGAPALRGTAREVVAALLPLRGIGAAAVTSDGAGSRATPAASGFAVVAVDIPSGIDPDTGETADEIVLPADLTVTFGGVKAGLLRGEGERRAGRVELIEIGIEAELGAMTPAVARSE